MFYKFHDLHEEILTLSRKTSKKFINGCGAPSALYTGICYDDEDKNPHVHTAPCGGHMWVYHPFIPSF